MKRWDRDLGNAAIGAGLAVAARVDHGIVGLRPRRRASKEAE
jgi:hypothetical protein